MVVSSTFNTTDTRSAEAVLGIRSDAYIFTLVVGYAFLGLTGLVGNFLVILVVWRSKPMQNPTNFLLVSVAISDFLFFLAAIPDSIVVTLSRKVLSKSLTLRKLVHAWDILFSFFSVISTITLSLLAIERYNAMVHPMKVHRRLNKRNAKIAIGMIWLTAILFVSPFGIRCAVILQKHESKGYWEEFSLGFQMYLLTLSILILVIPVLTVAFCYGKIIFGIYVVRNICSQTTRQPQDVRNKKKLVKMLLLVTLLFIAGHLPSSVFITYQVFRDTYLMDMIAVVTVFNMLSPCLNPIVYFICNTNYREGVKRLLKGCCFKKTSDRNASWRLEISRGETATDVTNGV